MEVTTRMSANPLSTRLDQDRLYMVPRDKACHTAHAALHPINHETPELLTAGAVLLFAAVVERSQMSAQELYYLGSRMLHHHEPHHHKANASLEALRDFAGLRIRNQPIV